jgi:glutaredoxin-related protein
MRMYGSYLCPDVLNAMKTLKEHGIEYIHMDITADLSHLKTFLRIRESSPLFLSVRANGSIGIPCFEMNSGEITLNVEDVLKQHPNDLTADSKGE